MSYDKAVTCKGTKVEIRPSKKATSGTPNGKASAGRVNAQVETNDGKNVEHLLIETIPGADKMASQSNNYDGDMFKFMDELLTHEGHNVFKAMLKKKGLENVSAQEQPGAWKQFLPSFLTAYTNTVNLRDTQFRYLEHEQHKPFNMSSTDYARRLETVVDLSKQFEGIKPEPNDQELKDMFLRGHPKAHVLEYAKSKNYSTDTIEDITRFMDILHDADVISGKIKEIEDKQKKKKKAALEEDNRYEGRVERRSRRNGKSSRDNRRRNERDGRSEKKRYLRDDEPCPVHPNGSHTWGQCSYNPKNKNRDEDKRRDRDNDKKRKKDEVRHHSHYQYESASDPEESAGDDESYYTASSRDSRGSYSDDESVKKVKKTKSSKKTKKAKKSRRKDAAYQIHSGASEDQEPLKNDGGNLYNDE